MDGVLDHRALPHLAAVHDHLEVGIRAGVIIPGHATALLRRDVRPHQHEAPQVRGGRDRLGHLARDCAQGGAAARICTAQEKYDARIPIQKPCRSMRASLPHPLSRDKSLEALRSRRRAGRGCKLEKMRRAKIVCTIGPASSIPEMIQALVAAGMDCARLNFSHGSHEDHAKVGPDPARGGSQSGAPVAILADLSGPKMRVGRFPGGSDRAGARPTLHADGTGSAGDQGFVSVTYKPLPRDVKPGRLHPARRRLAEVGGRSRGGRGRPHNVLEAASVEQQGPQHARLGSSAPALTEKDKIRPRTSR